VRGHAGRWKHPERVAQPMRHQRKADDDAQERIGPRREDLIEVAKRGEDERRRVDHEFVVPALAHRRELKTRTSWILRRRRGSSNLWIVVLRRGCEAFLDPCPQ